MHHLIPYLQIPSSVKLVAYSDLELMHLCSHRESENHVYSFVKQPQCNYSGVACSYSLHYALQAATENAIAAKDIKLLRDLIPKTKEFPSLLQQIQGQLAQLE